MITQHLTLPDGSERTWMIDTAAAAAVASWISRSPHVFEDDLNGMATYFPHWILVGGAQGKPLRCKRCSNIHVPTTGALRCVSCHSAARADSLLWIGHVPALARSEPCFATRRQALYAAGFPEARAGELDYLLVPLTLCYPAEWPNVEPVLRYSGRWLDALGLPHASAAHHLIGDGHACLFAWGQWSAMPVHAVLQQRVVNHIASLLKIAAGLPPAQAFIGRIDHANWQPHNG